MAASVALSSECMAVQQPIRHSWWPIIASLKAVGLNLSTYFIKRYNLKSDKSPKLTYVRLAR